MGIAVLPSKGGVRQAGLLVTNSANLFDDVVQLFHFLFFLTSRIRYWYCYSLRVVSAVFC